MNITPQTASGFEEGILELSAVYLDCGIIEIEVTDIGDISKIGSSGPVLFLPASFILFLSALFLFLYSTFYINKTMDISVIILTMSAIQITFFGLLADIISRRERKWTSC